MNEASFLSDVKSHRIDVLKDSDGLRHIRFKSPDSMYYWFELVTWPGSLCVTGDMGTFVFRRLPDMFEFFRSNPARAELRINPQYWHEKLESADHCDGAKRFSKTKFMQFVTEAAQEAGVDAPTWQRIADEVLSADHNEHTAREAIDAFRAERAKGLFEAADEWDLHEYTERFMWCCYAIVWGIRQYDERLADGGAE